MKIPWQNLEPETLENLIDSVILREEVFDDRYSLDQQRQKVLDLLTKGELEVIWNDTEQSIDIKPKGFFDSLN